MSTKICNYCKQEKSLSKFNTRIVNGIKYPATRCYSCLSIIAKEKGWRDPKTTKEIEKRAYERVKERRALGLSVAKDIYADSRKVDKKKNRPNDLDKEFIEDLISNPCSYCGETEIRMTLDRIDNDGGHTKNNVVPACYRCNYTRGNMPYRAWLFLAEGMKSARLAGAFGDWASKSVNRKS